ncbi:MAG TPA: thioredoxin domain-containing protein [Panacibacter sp.]|nr:thioredoxin domain-containing protein [Panacibacter sp.]HNP44370.1 thioredoxin domain-containing protein [Panacibacter sp.]
MKYALNLLLSILLLSLMHADAQKHDTKKMVPPFDIELTNSKHFKANELKKEIPVIIIYFDPTCEHCHAFTGEMLKHYKEFGNTQIVMISYTPVAQVVKFEADFSLMNYPTIKVGTEGESFVVQRFYGVQKFPFIALYDKTGLITAYHRTPTTVDVVLKELKKQSM